MFQLSGAHPTGVHAVAPGCGAKSLPAVQAVQVAGSSARSPLYPASHSQTWSATAVAGVFTRAWAAQRVTAVHFVLRGATKDASIKVVRRHQLGEFGALL